ncbi:MAG: DUF4159 domain-containing protein [Pirellulaceae bacterium]
MLRGLTVAVLSVAGLATMAQPVAAQEELTAEQVRRSIERGVDYLKAQQNREKGAWGELPGYPGGVSSLVTLALLNSGVPEDDPVIQRSLAHLRTIDKPGLTYCVALQTMVFCLASPEKDRLQITRNVNWLEANQIEDGPRRGAWSYSGDRGRGDNSNSQFALLALYEAERVGVKVDRRTWSLAREYWLNTQREDGAWGYYEGQPSTGSMTCAGITSLVITMDRLTEGDASVVGDSVQCCGERDDVEPIEKALAWMGSKFSVTSNPVASSNPSGVVGSDSLLYYLYGMERVGRLTGRRFFVKTSRAGFPVRFDWYRKGAEHLVEMQDSLSGFWVGEGHAEQEPVIGTSFALLFLSKGRRPVLLAKYKHREDDDWNLHRNGVHNLTRSVEKSWKRDLTWQIIEARAASVEDLLQTPVLFISGRETLFLTEQEKRKLRQYVDMGGFIFAEACHGNGCNGEAFDRSFRELMAELFPESPLRVLPLDHPVWFAEKKVDPDYLPDLYGVDSCCRTSIVYCPENLSCLWELARQGRDSEHPPKVREHVASALALGQNVLAYATNRELEDKLRPRVVTSDDDLTIGRHTLAIPKLAHTGGSDDAPNALRNMLRIANQKLELPVSADARLVKPTDPRLLEHPILFMHGRRDFRFSPEERSALKAYLERGGFLLADSICASEAFTDAFRREMKAIFPEAPLEPLPSGDPLLTQEFRGFDLSSVQLRDPLGRDPGDPLRARIIKTPPRLEVLKTNGRVAVVFSPFDISCALENHTSLECKGYLQEDAARIAVNVLLYALQQ